MFEKFSSEYSGDFRQRYQGTFGFYNDRDRKNARLVFLTAVGDEDVSFSDERGVSYSLNADVASEKGFEFLPPKSRYYNASDGSGAILVQRIASKQFSRGLCNKNVKIRHLHRNGEHLSLGVTFSTLKKIYSEISTVEAFRRFQQQGVSSVALSPMFALSDDGQLFVLGEPIGTFKEGAIQMSNDLFTVEIRDVFRNLSQEVEVKNANP